MKKSTELNLRDSLIAAVVRTLIGELIVLMGQFPSALRIHLYSDIRWRKPKANEALLIGLHGKLWRISTKLQLRITTCANGSSALVMAAVTCLVGMVTFEDYVGRFHASVASTQMRRFDVLL